MRVVGVDGCRGGWLAASVDATAITWTWTKDIAAVVSADAEVVTIDIPIGLPDVGSRACDVEARRRLGRRAVTVFAAPVRAVLDCASYAEARAVLAARGGPSMSAQAFGIVAAVRAVDRAVTPADEPRVVEAHPETAFAQMAGRVLPPKRTADGEAERTALLARVWPDVADIVAAAPRPARRDDALDALACAWVAQRWCRGESLVLGDGSRDARGLQMRIAV